MASLTHRAMRTLIHEIKPCDIYFTEMVNAGSLVSGDRFKKYYIDAEPAPDRTVIQLVGSKIEHLCDAAKFCDELPIFGIDLNMGCSAPEIVRLGAGVAWMQEITLARELVARMREKIKERSFSVKLRLGWAENPEYLLAFCKMLESEGVDFITVHPRLKTEKLRRTARWESIAPLKQELKIPVLGNGDIISKEKMQKALSQSGVDGIMIGREATRRPWIFSLLKDEAQSINREEIAYRFLELLELYQPKEFHESRIRRFFFYYCDTFSFGHAPKCKMQLISTTDEAREILKTYFEEVPADRELSF